VKNLVEGIFGHPDFWVKNGCGWIFGSLVFGLKMGMVLYGGILGTPDIELKSRVGILKTSRN